MQRNRLYEDRTRASSMMHHESLWKLVVRPPGELNKLSRQTSASSDSALTSIGYVWMWQTQWIRLEGTVASWVSASKRTFVEGSRYCRESFVCHQIRQETIKNVYEIKRLHKKTRIEKSVKNLHGNMTYSGSFCFKIKRLKQCDSIFHAVFISSSALETKMNVRG